MKTQNAKKTLQEHACLRELMNQTTPTGKTAVIIPAYNAQDTIERCLDSLAAQTNPDWQAWVVDDGSIDATWSLLEQRAKVDKRIHLLQGGHRGAAAARNLALEQVDESDAGSITFLDSDDYLEPDALLRMAEAMERTGADVVQCKYFSDFTDGHRIEPRDLFSDGAVFTPNEFPRTVYLKMITTIQMNHVCIKFYRAHLLRGRRFDETMRTAEDLLFNVDLFAGVQRYTYIATPLYHYVRDNKQGLTNSGLSSVEKLRCNWKVSKRMLHYLPEWKMDTLPARFLVMIRPMTLIASKLARKLAKILIRKEA